MKTLTVVLLPLIVLALIGGALGCGGGSDENQEEIALQVAKDWTGESISNIAEDIADAVTLGIPVLSNLAKPLIEEQIRANVHWSYSTPVKRADSRYDVVSTASVPIVIDIPFISTTYDVSVDYDLDIDTKERQVVDSQLNLSSLSVRER
jgi:hypothetical protein